MKKNVIVKKELKKTLVVKREISDRKNVIE